MRLSSAAIVMLGLRERMVAKPCSACAAGDSVGTAKLPFEPVEMIKKRATSASAGLMETAFTTIFWDPKDTRLLDWPSSTIYKTLPPFTNVEKKIGDNEKGDEDGSSYGTYNPSEIESYAMEEGDGPMTMEEPCPVFLGSILDYDEPTLGIFVGTFLDWEEPVLADAKDLVALWSDITMGVGEEIEDDHNEETIDVVHSDGDDIGDEELEELVPVTPASPQVPSETDEVCFAFPFLGRSKSAPATYHHGAGYDCDTTATGNTGNAFGSFSMGMEWFFLGPLLGQPVWNRANHIANEWEPKS